MYRTTRKQLLNKHRKCDIVVWLDLAVHAACRSYHQEALSQTRSWIFVYLLDSIMSRTTFYYDAAFPLIYGMVCSGFISGGLLNNVKLRQIVSTQIRPYLSQTILLCVYKIPCVRSDSKSLFNLEFRFLWVRSSSHQEKLYKPPMLG